MRVVVDALLLSARPSYRRSGIARYSERLLGALPAALAPEDDLIVHAPASVPTSSGLERGWRSAPRRLPLERATIRAAWEQAALPLLARRESPDLLHGLVNVVPLLAPCPTVVTVHDLAFLRLPELVPARRRRYFAAILRTSVRRAARVIAVSEHTKADIVDLLRVPPERIAVTPLATDESFRPAAEATLAGFRATQRLDRPYVLYVGNLEPRKNLPALLRAFAAIAPAVPHDLILVGAPGWMMGEFHATLGRLRLGGRVRLAGHAAPEVLPLWYAAADLFVFPSHYEGFGLPPLEAMACGTPVIASAVSALPEVVGNAAVTVDPADVEELAGAMRRVLTNPTLAAELRARGLRRAARFSWAQTAAATVRVYRELTS